MELLKSYESGQVQRFMRGHKIKPVVPKGYTQYPKDNRYYVSKDGKVLKKQKGSIKKLKGSRQASGHMSISLGKKKRVFLHRMVLETFIGDSTQLCRHLNGNPGDNRLENLIYGTFDQNAQDTKDHAVAKCINKYVNNDKLIKSIISDVTVLDLPSNVISVNHNIPIHLVELIKKIIDCLLFKDALCA